MTDPWSSQPPAGPPLTDPVGPPPTVQRPPAWAPPNPPPPNEPATPPSRSGGRAVRALVAVLVLGGLLLAGFAVGRLTSATSMDDVDGVELVDSGAAAPAPVTDPGADEEPVAAVAEAVAPAVVRIDTGLGVGSGVVFDEEGLLITNAHVVGGASSVEVGFADGSRATGQVVGVDVATDVAVVEVDAAAVLGVAELALGEEVRVGQLAVAIGSPFNLDQTVTSGIVSALDRPFRQGEIAVGMIQTDAPINSGNSGGALADRHGRVIGINTAIFSTTGDNTGIGFAIPIDIAHTQARKILGGESLESGFLGVSGGPAPTGQPGALVTGVEPGSAAEAAGIRVGDVIVTIDDDEVKDIGQLAVAVSARSPGDEVELEVVRDGDTITVTAELGRR